jgi:hypothetical protein
VRRNFVKVSNSRVVSLVTAAVLAGCTNSSDDETQSLDQWLGDTPHFAVSGKFDGIDYNHRVQGDAAIAAHLNCIRYYAPLPGALPNAGGTYDASQMYFIMKDMSAVFDVNGKPTEFGTAYWGNDPGVGTDLEVIPMNFGTSIPAGHAWVDFQVEDYPKAGPPTKPIRGAEGGTVSLKVSSGSPEPGSAYVATGGRTGVFFSINWGPQESLRISATADCSDSVLALWARTLVLP